jgi:hypothetical protein
MRVVPFRAKKGGRFRADPGSDVGGGPGRSRLLVVSRLSLEIASPFFALSKWNNPVAIARPLTVVRMGGARVGFPY